ncbi:MAG: Hsp20/alpha crystallin family protein [Opitutales bacterium]|nr:Hsp20/alpha crystallin family protein [Opitutales bacterium]
MRLIKYDNLYNDTLSELDRFFDRTFGSFPAFPGMLTREDARGFRVDLNHDADNYYVLAELPGVDKKDVNIELENAVLTISGERKSGGEAGGESTFRFSRFITVGDDVVADKVKAKLENGILTVTLPKREERKPRMISVS